MLFKYTNNLCWKYGRWCGYQPVPVVWFAGVYFLCDDFKLMLIGYGYHCSFHPFPKYCIGKYLTPILSDKYDVILYKKF